MFYLICLIPIAVAMGLSLIARQQRLGLTGLAVHPFNLLGFFVVVTVIDFVVAYLTVSGGESIRLARYSEDSPAAVQSGMAFFALCSLSVLIGCLLGARGAKPSAAPGHDEIERASRRATLIVTGMAAALATFTVFLAVAAALSKGSISYVAATKGVFFRNNPVLFVLYSTVIPAFFLFGSRFRRPGHIILAFCAATALLLPVGSRGSLVILAVGAAFWLGRNWRLPVIALYVSSPIVAFGLTLYQWFVRESSVYATFSQFLDARGGIGGALFNTPEISMAESITLNVHHSIIHRTPWDSILGIILIPAPRSLLPFKPFGASTEFTQNADLARWLMVKSDWTVTGFVNLLMDFGYVGAVMLSGCLAFIWARTLARAAGHRTEIAFAGPMLIYVMYAFFRADLYQVGVILWPAAIVLLAERILRQALSMKRNDARRNTPRARAASA